MIKVIEHLRRWWHPGNTYARQEKARLEHLASFFANEEVWAESLHMPIYVQSLQRYLYQNCLYKVTGPLTHDQKSLLVLEAFDGERRRFERLQNKFSGGVDKKYSRTPIPERTRIEVWRRDGGACAKCGSRERLEYDHIIPVSKGGSNTGRNIELLCESCNRAKQAEIQ